MGRDYVWPRPAFSNVVLGTQTQVSLLATAGPFPTSRLPGLSQGCLSVRGVCVLGRVEGEGGGVYVGVRGIYVYVYACMCGVCVVCLL